MHAIQQHLCFLFQKQRTLQSILSLLEWDQETYMPANAIASRSRQIECITSLLHKEKTSAEFTQTLASAIDLSSGKILVPASLAFQTALQEWRKELLQEQKLPLAFVEEFAATTAQALHIFPEAKKQGNFPLIAPHLEKIVDLSREKARLWGYQDHPYDALLDIYEPGLTVSYLSPLFTDLKNQLIALIPQTHKSASLPCVFTHPFDPIVQKKLGEELLQALGFDPSHSRLDLSTHPFCTGIDIQDTRMTTKIDPTSPLSSLFSVLHEAGHGLYNKNLPMEYQDTPLCQPASFGIDESQSRFWETCIGKSLPFWRYFYPKLQKSFPEALASYSLEHFYSMIQTVSPSLIRIESDEVTYSLHIILRFEIEKSLIEGSIQVKDIPRVWKEKMAESLLPTPTHDGEGCLQDIHWAMGGIGYFPSYALGNILAAELFAILQQTMPHWDQEIQKGNFSPILSFLEQKIHRHGRFYTPKNLILQATGKPLSIDSYIQHLKNRYTM